MAKTPIQFGDKTAINGRVSTLGGWRLPPYSPSVLWSGIAVEEFVISSVIRLVGWSHFARFNYGVSFAGAVVVASIVCWLGMSIPLIVAGNIGVWAALKKSVELSNGYEGALFWLVVQSVAGSFVAWYATYSGLRWLFPDELRHTLWYGWLVYIAAVLARAAVEPPLFIGFPSSQIPIN